MLLMLSSRLVVTVLIGYCRLQPLLRKRTLLRRRQPSWNNRLKLCQRLQSLRLQTLRCPPLWI
jgi:hypothetical protein